jgi:hypothetical protein
VRLIIRVKRFNTSFLLLLVFFCTVVGAGMGADTPRTSPIPTALENNHASYYWQASRVGDTAELLTLFCRSCAAAAVTGQDTPLVAVLRDTLGDNSTQNDRLIYVWLLTYSRPSFGQHLLSAVPFFYWRVAEGSARVSPRDTKPLLDLTAPRHPVLADVSRELLQYAVLDPTMLPIRATSRAYRSNGEDHQRLHLEEAISYLNEAPSATSEAEPTSGQLHTLIARLELRKKLLGGFVSERNAAKFGERQNFEQERIRLRNWELLRQSAERTGLIFEPMDLAGTTGQYALLSFSQTGRAAPAGPPLAADWKLLGIRNPWKDPRIAALPARDGRTPLGFYSLNYPRHPLLLVDFRDKLHLRGHEIVQRSINEITSGIIGISHITNWYYYVGADLYNFVVSRRGGATNQAERLDCYSQFRVALALDQQLDPTLRAQLHRRGASLAVNPLEASMRREVETARARYSLLTDAGGDDGRLARQLQKSRRAELAEFGTSPKRQFAADFLHNITLGLYTRRAEESRGNLAKLDSYRRIQSDLGFLDGLAAAGTAPEVAFQPALIKPAINDLAARLQQISSLKVRAHAQQTLRRVRELSQDSTLQADCSSALALLEYRPLLQAPVKAAVLGVPAAPLASLSEASLDPTPAPEMKQ